MNELELTVACWDYDRVRPLIDGRVKPDGIKLNFLTLPPEDVFFRAFRHLEFDVSELSFSTTLMTLSRDVCPYTPIPVFPSRSFRHSCIYVRRGSGIEKPSDLIGRRVAISEYQVTAAMVARGILADEYGVHARDVQWVQAGLEQAGRIEKVAWTPPEDVNITKIGDRSIMELWDAGEVDALITPRAPSRFDADIDGSGTIQRLFPDHATQEAQWYQKTGIFPVMHMLGLRNDIMQRHPWAAVSLLRAFTKAKDIALADLGQTAALKISLPFLPAYFKQTQSLFGEDFWSYGVHANRTALDTQLRWSHEQGLSHRRVAIEELFPASCLEDFKV